LRESEEKYRTLFEASTDAIFLTTLDGAIRDANASACRMFGYARKEILSLRAWALAPPEEEAKMARIVEEELKNSRVWGIQMESAGLRKDGSIFPTEVSLRVMPVGGEPCALIYVRDTTERKRAEEALRASEERFRVLFEQAADIIFLLEITPEGIPVIRDANSASFRLLGYERDELIGQPVSVIEAEPDASKVVNERRENVLSGLGTLVFEAKHRCKDGTIRDFECSVTEMQIGSKTLAVSVERDITERRSLEAQLLQAQKMEAVGMLAGGIAHEFNNILGAILGYASLLRMKMEPDHPFRGYVETIEKSSQRAAALTSQLLGFARKGKYDLRLLNLNLLAEDTLAIVRQTFDRAVTVEARLAESLPKVEGDTMQLQQVLMNLCINARDAMPQGGSLVLTTWTEQVAEGDERIPLESKAGLYVLLSVADTGCGMDEKTQAKIFEPFFTTKEKSKGTGLGLAMVYGVVKNHGGFVIVQSEVGRGSVFTLHLPAAEKPSDRKPEALAAPEKSRGAVPDQSILVADDEEAIRFLARDILEGEGYRVLLAEDGAQALEVFREHQREIGLVVLDLIMPKLGGGEVFVKMKEMDPGVHVLVSSGYSQEGKAQEILSGGALGFVQKPFYVRDLVSKVRQGLDGGGIQNGK
jgi:PAS domain S-box-containing protein